MDRPTFGVLPDHGVTAGHESEVDGIREVVEFDHRGHRVLGIEFSSGTDVVGDTCSMVQLRTPVVPALVLTARTGALAPERFTPLEDAKLVRNTVGAPKPDVALRKVEPRVDLYRRFTVTTADPDFLEVLRTADTSDKAWDHGQRSVLTRVNKRRRAAERQPVTARSLVVRTVFALALVLLGLPLVGNGLATLTGLAPEVRMKVTDTFENDDDEDARDLVSGFYEVDGTTHTITDSRWSSFTDLPLVGEVIRVHVGPFWWHPMIETADTAVFVILLGLVPLLPGLMLARRTYLPRPPRRTGDAAGRG